MSSTTSNSVPNKIRVVTYNVLSSHLASPDHFTSCDPQHLEASKRLPKVFQKIDDAINNEEKVLPIFCLQEVSQSWAGKMHTFFANKNYHFITGLYGKPFNNYMGIAIAFPLDTFEVMDVDISRLSDYREGGWPRMPIEEPNNGLIPSVLKTIRNTVGKGLKTFILRPAMSLLPITPPKPPIDHWKLSENRFNIFLFCRLRLKNSNSNNIFCISNYHMPCAFYAPMVMNIHAEMVVKRTQTLASTCPYILAGDFNLMPCSPTYNLITTGVLSKEDETYPTPKYGMEWESTIKPMRSAYAESHNREPDFTNFAQTRDDEPFVGTLDYIFLSKHWKVNNVLNTIHRSKADGPFPNSIEPSDHIMIWSDLEL